MREYDVTIDSGLCGYDFNYIVEAETRDIAEQKAMQAWEYDMMLMHKRAHVCKIIDNGIIDD